MGFTPPKWLRDGDVVRVEIDGIGAIENRFVALHPHPGPPPGRGRERRP
jgi:hypothetical protein